jgi:hypothetical protein
MDFISWYSSGCFSYTWPFKSDLVKNTKSESVLFKLNAQILYRQFSNKVEIDSDLNLIKF